jgi:streptomycin 6-kinase
MRTTIALVSSGWRLSQKPSMRSRRDGRLSSQSLSCRAASALGSRRLAATPAMSWCFRELPRTAARRVLLCADLHAGNVLASQRDPWLVIDPKPFIGDPAFDAVQHMLNCGERIASDPAALAERMAGLLEVEAERVRLWLFTRCVQEALHDQTMREPARRLAF